MMLIAAKASSLGLPLAAEMELPSLGRRRRSPASRRPFQPPTRSRSEIRIKPKLSFPHLLFSGPRFTLCRIFQWFWMTSSFCREFFKIRVIVSLTNVTKRGLLVAKSSAYFQQLCRFEACLSKLPKLLNLPALSPFRKSFQKFSFVQSWS